MREFTLKWIWWSKTWLKFNGYAERTKKKNSSILSYTFWKFHSRLWYSYCIPRYGVINYRIWESFFFCSKKNIFIANRQFHFDRLFFCLFFSKTLLYAFKISSKFCFKLRSSNFQNFISEVVENWLKKIDKSWLFKQYGIFKLTSDEFASKLSFDACSGSICYILNIFYDPLQILNFSYFSSVPKRDPKAGKFLRINCHWSMPLIFSFFYSKKRIYKLVIFFEKLALVEVVHFRFFFSL